MDFDNSFTVAVPLDALWPVLLDLERIVPCVPGAKVLERVGDDACKVSIKLKVGAVQMVYTGEVELVERDDAAHRAILRTKARESRGQGSAQADVEMRLAGDGARSTADLHTDVRLMGKAASMGHGVMADISAQLIQRFAANLEAMLGADGTAA